MYIHLCNYMYIYKYTFIYYTYIHIHMSSQSFVAKMLTPGKAQEGSEGKSGEPPHEGRAVNYVMASTILLLLDWLKGKSTENQKK